MAINNKWSSVYTQHLSPVNHNLIFSLDARPLTLHRETVQIGALSGLSRDHARQIYNLQDSARLFYGANWHRFELQRKTKDVTEQVVSRTHGFRLWLHNYISTSSSKHLKSYYNKQRTLVPGIIWHFLKTVCENPRSTFQDKETCL